VFMLQKTATPVFYALRQPRIPMVTGLVFVGVNFCCNVASVVFLPQEWKHVGIAGSTVLTSAAQGIVLACLLRGPIGGVRWRNVLPVYARVLVCAAVMGIAVWFAHGFISNAVQFLPPKPAQAVSVLSAIALGAAVYLGAAAILCRRPLREMSRDLRPRR